MSEVVERYLGDGLYASFDGWQVILRAPRTDGDHWIGLEPAVLAGLVEFLAELNRQYPGVPVYQAVTHTLQKL